jgi:hypothetical protein
MRCRYRTIGYGLSGRTAMDKEEKIESTRPTVTLVGENGNVYNIIALCKKAARKAGWSKERIDELTKRMMGSGNYDDVLGIVMDEFDVD